MDFQACMVNCVWIQERNGKSSRHVHYYTLYARWRNSDSLHLPEKSISIVKSMPVQIFQTTVHILLFATDIILQTSTYCKYCMCRRLLLFWMCQLFYNYPIISFAFAESSSLTPLQENICFVLYFNLKYLYSHKAQCSEFCCSYIHEKPS